MALGAWLPAREMLQTLMNQRSEPMTRGSPGQRRHGPWNARKAEAWPGIGDGADVLVADGMQVLERERWQTGTETVKSFLTEPVVTGVRGTVRLL